jgi:hypothetical protein
MKMAVLKIVGKIFLVPVLLALFLLGLVIAAVGGIYQLLHGVLWGLLIILIVLFAVFGMWQNVIFGIVLMSVSLIIVTALDGLSALIGSAVGSVLGLLRA